MSMNEPISLEPKVLSASFDGHLPEVGSEVSVRLTIAGNTIADDVFTVIQNANNDRIILIYDAVTFKMYTIKDIGNETVKITIENDDNLVGGEEITLMVCKHEIVTTDDFEAAVHKTVDSMIPNYSASWREIKRNVKLGRGETLYPIHTIFNVRSKKFGMIPFEVVAHDADEDPDNANAHTITLHCLEGLTRDKTFGYAFDATEKLCVCPNGLAAGTYSIDNGYVSFTLTNNVPANGFLAIDLDLIQGIAVSIKSYSSDGTIVETAPIVEDAQDESATDLSTVIDSGDMNDIDRAYYGSGNYGQSNIRQWLNGRGRNWYQAATKFDMPPLYVGDEGFLDDLDSEFVDVLLATEQTVRTNGRYEIGEGMSNATYTVTDKVFLPSGDQIFAPWNGQTPANPEGTLWDGYDFSESNLSNNEQNLARVKYAHSHKGEFPVGWWLRSGDAGCVMGDGGRGGDGACGPRFAVAPACVI